MSDGYAVVWRDHSTSRNNTLLTYMDHSDVAIRDYEEVTRANPPLHILEDSDTDRNFLEDWLADRSADQNTTLAVPVALVRDILGWDL